jgi:hypothetical protein
MALTGGSLPCSKSSGIEGAADEKWRRRVRLFMTHLRHWLCTAAMVLMPVLAPINVLV